MSELASGRGGTVLLVEGEDHRRALLEQAFSRRSSDLEIVSARAAAEALLALRAAQPDLIVASAVLPDLSGLDLLDRLREGGCPAPVVILEAGPLDEAASAEAADRAMCRGAADYLPCTPATLAKLPWLADRYLKVHRPDPGLPAAAARGPELASISHDMRSPLSGLMALLDMLDAGADGPLRPAQQERLRRVRESVERLVLLAEQIADLAQVESGQLTLARGPVDLERAALEAKKALEPLLRSRAVTLEVAVPSDLPRPQGDSRRVRQIVTCLVCGLLKQLEGSAVELRAASAGSMVEVTLREAPHALPVEALRGAFRGEEEDAADLGADAGACQGIHLAVARGLVRLHGGRLRIGRQSGGGLTASFTLPFAASEARRRAERAQDLRRTT